MLALCCRICAGPMQMMLHFTLCAYIPGLGVTIEAHLHPTCLHPLPPPPPMAPPACILPACIPSACNPSPAPPCPPPLPPPPPPSPPLPPPPPCLHSTCCLQDAAMECMKTFGTCTPCNQGHLIWSMQQKKQSGKQSLLRFDYHSW